MARSVGIDLSPGGIGVALGHAVEERPLRTTCGACVWFNACAMTRNVGSTVPRCLFTPSRFVRKGGAATGVPSVTGNDAVARYQ